jgi:hypothetical protein
MLFIFVQLNYLNKKHIMNLMKTFLLAFIGFLSISQVQAQDEITEGYIKMKITEVSSDDDQMEAMLQMMVGTITEYFFNPEKALVKADVMGGMVKMTSLTNIEDGFVTLLMDMMGNKMMVESTKEEREELQGDQAEIMQELEVTFDESDTKDILGLNCVKAAVALPDQPEGLSFEMYIARDLQLSNQVVQGMEYLELGGFPLEYIFSTGQMDLKIEAEDIAYEVNTDAFDLSTAGFTKMTMAEFIESMGAMGGGGLGF